MNRFELDRLLRSAINDIQSAMKAESEGYSCDVGFQVARSKLRKVAAAIKAKEPYKDRVVREILDDVEIYIAGEGPEGPWEYDTLLVYRRMNTIKVYDVDDRLYDILEVPDCSEIDDVHERLQRKLDELNKESLNEL